MCYINSSDQQTENDMTTYQIIDIQTKQVVGRVYTTRKAASARADKLDHAYGAIRYVVKPIFA